MTVYDIFRSASTRANTSRLTVVAIAVVGVSMAGCGGSATKDKFKKFERGTVSGAVTYEGKPVPAGVVSFRHKESGNQASFTIKEGKYKSGAADGPQLGLNSVEVFGRETTDATAPFVWGGPFRAEVTIEKSGYTGDFTVTKDKVKPPGKPPKADDEK